MKKGKSAPINITPEVQRHLKRYKIRLQEMADNDNLSESEIKVIDIVLHKLSLYEKNFICAYFDLADCRATKLGKIFGISPSVVQSRIKKIIKKIKSKL